MPTAGSEHPIIRVGIIGCGLVSQGVHLPTLAALSHLYQVTAVCDASPSAVAHAKSKFGIAHGFEKSEELVRHEEVDMVIVCSPDEFHHEHIVEAVEAGKHVLAEKPMVLTRQHLELVRSAQAAHPDVFVGVGYMRRYAPAFLEFKKLLAESGPIRHAVVQDIIGPVSDLPNDTFVEQSGFYPLPFGTDIPAASTSQFKASAARIAEIALGPAKASDARLVTILRLLGSLGSHDLSLMREAFGGTPSKCLAAFASADGNFINAHFVYDRSKAQDGGDSFSVQYMTGLHQVATFDAHIEVWTDTRVLRINYDTPFVKGLPITITVKENVAPASSAGNQASHYSERTLRPTYKDAYTAQFEAFAEALHARTKGAGARADAGAGAGAVAVDDSTLFKTTVDDAAEELDVFDLILRALDW